MIRQWGDLDARARGLSSRLLDHRALLTLAGAAGLPSLRAAFPAGLRPAEGAEGPTPIDLERAARAHAARQLAVLSRWADRRRHALALIFEEEDLRSARAIVRGAAGSLPPARRLAGLLPTPSLPEPALVDAAEASTPQAALERLADWGRPDAEQAALAAGGITPDLFRVESLLARGFARRVEKAARRGGRALGAAAAQSVDLENAWTAFFADGFASEVAAEDLFLNGGRALDRERFLRAAEAHDPTERRRIVAGAFAGGPLGDPFGDLATPWTRLERAILRARIEEQRRARHLDPLGPAPLLEFALRLRGQLRDLQTVVWGVTLDASPDVVAADLVAS